MPPSYDKQSYESTEGTTESRMTHPDEASRNPPGRSVTSACPCRIAGPQAPQQPKATSNCRRAGAGSPAGRRYPWAELLKRVFAVDVLSCHRCGGRREVLALITKGSVVCAILECLGLPTEGPVVHPARGPPELF